MKPRESLVSGRAARGLYHSAMLSPSGTATVRYTPAGVAYEVSLQRSYRRASQTVRGHSPEWSGGAKVTLTRLWCFTHTPFRVRLSCRLAAGWGELTVSRAIHRLHGRLDVLVRLSVRREAVYHIAEKLPIAQQEDLHDRMQEAGHLTTYADMDAAGLTWLEAELSLPSPEA